MLSAFSRSGRFSVMRAAPLAISRRIDSNSIGSSRWASAVAD
jgi:hypothetical protein